MSKSCNIEEIVLLTNEQSSYPGKVWQSFVAYSHTGMKLDTMMLVNEDDNNIYNTIYKSLSSRLRKDGTWAYPSLSKLSPYLKFLVKEINLSTNEMWFVEYDDDVLNELMANNPDFLDRLKDEVMRLGLSDVIDIEGSDHCFISVYSSFMSDINYDEQLL